MSSRAEEGRSSLRLSDSEILDCISEHTTEIKRGLWLRQIRYNEEHYGFKNGASLKDLQERYSGRKAVVLAAGPGFKRFGVPDLKEVLTAEPVVVSCDGALPTLAGIGYRPDFVVSVDAHPVVANFYRRSRKVLEGATVLLSTTINRDVVEECLAAGAKVEWIQSFFKEDSRFELFYRPGVISVTAGGNVGTTSFMIAAMALGCRPVGLMGLEFAWSDETPYNETQYYDELKRIVGEENVPDYFKRVNNYRDGKTYIADPVYYSYSLMFKEIWDSLSVEITRSTVLLTKQGILDVPGLKFMSAKAFAKL